MTKKIDDFYLKRYYAFYRWAKDYNRSPEYVLEDLNVVKAAYERGDWKYVNAYDKDLTGFINEAPIVDRRNIYKYIEKETGIKADFEEGKRKKTLDAILKRGKINNDDEYYLVHGEIDILCSEYYEDPEAMKRAQQLDKIMLKYSTSFSIE